MAPEEPIVPKTANAESIAAEIIEEVKFEHDSTLEKATLVNAGLQPMSIQDNAPSVNMPETMAIDVSEIVVQPPKLINDDPAGGLGVGQFFAIVVFVSIMLYVIRKSNELK